MLTSPRGELSHRGGSPSDDLSDLGELHAEEVVQDPCGALGGTERLEHHHEREADGVVECDPLGRI